MKIASTALLYRVIMKKQIGAIQSFALFMLILAGVCNSIGGSVRKPQQESPEESGVIIGVRITKLC